LRLAADGEIRRGGGGGDAGMKKTAALGQ